ncbi:hypothetical protein [Leifsonia sp. TF02-11]|uniref:hypothetical protein n=1 Tax=Leifsonia sp. TF02-11 TaxID=2815212 RepID=UPI001AA16A19|nr:hypothetical protein [Leifsonia sp. TF02-11]MBO1740004.1 hypothetical protein [Leifsonia sp. TF02-11]
MTSSGIAALGFIYSLLIGLIVAAVSLLITWAVIRSAVLSALRKHHAETNGSTPSQIRE